MELDQERTSFRAPLLRKGYLMRSLSLALSMTALVTAFALPVRGQCPQWTQGLRAEFSGGSLPEAFTTFDSGDGPEMILGGGFRTAGDAVANGIARYDGTRFASLGEGLDGRADALAVFDDGSGPALYAGGQFTEAGSTSASNIARWDGTSWSALGSGLGDSTEEVTHLGVAAGELIAFGTFTTAGGLAATGFATWDGTSWSVPSAGPDGSVEDVATFDDGSGEALYLGGFFGNVGGSPINNLARWNGSVWSSVGDPDSIIYSLEVFDDGLGAQLYAAGGFTSVGGVSTTRVASWDGTTWSDQGFSTFDLLVELAVFDDGGGADLYAEATVEILDRRLMRLAPGVGWSNVVGMPHDFGGSLTNVQIGTDTRLAVFGEQFVVKGELSRGVRLWDGTQWENIGGPDNGVGGRIHAMARYDDGGGEMLYAVGEFLSAGGSDAFAAIRWDGTSWTQFGGGLNSPPLPHALAVFDGELYVGGFFDAAGGVFPANNLVRYNGGPNFFAVASGTSAPVRALHVTDLGGGDVLLVGGDFTTASGVDAKHIVTWDGSTFAPLDPNGAGLDATVRAITTFQGAVIVGGDFSFAGPSSAAHVAAWDGTSWSGLGTGLDGVVRALTVFDDGSGAKLVAGGDFQNAGGQPADRIALWDGSSWTALPGPFTYPPVPALGPRIEALAVTESLTSSSSTSAALVVGGLFTTVAGLDAGGLAWWDGTQWSVPYGDTDGTVRSFLAEPGQLTVGGTFSVAGGVASTSIAMLTDPCVAAETGAFCFGTDAFCPCGNAGAVDAGCDIQQGTGGVRLDVPSFTPDGLGGGDAILTGTGFPGTSTPTVVAIRSRDYELAPPVFGDGVRCIGLSNLVRVGAAFAIGGTSQRPVMHGSGGGSFYYQLWFRNAPAMFCTPDAFNLSNGYKLTW